MSIPLGERGGALRGVLDLVCGRLPLFVFGGGVGTSVPAFHFHDERRAQLEPKLRYLRENDYRTVNADQLAAVAQGRRRPDGREVALCFDDAWSTVWTDAAPLLRELGLTAIVYAIPGRISDAPGCRVVESADTSASPFMTWPELRALSASGTIDVQSHTFSHARIFTSAKVVDFVGPEYGQAPLLNRPALSTTPSLRVIDPTELGAPLYEQRSRMSDGRRVDVSSEAHQTCVETVRAGGGPLFFNRPGWRAELTAVVRRFDRRAPVETEAGRRLAIEDELDRSRSVLNSRLGVQSVRHVCLPWGVSGRTTSDALARLGFVSAVANRWRGTFAVRPGDDPLWLKRLPNRYVHALPGRGRRTLWLAGAATSTPQ